MKLREFVEKFVCSNSLIRLWKPIKGGHEMLKDYRLLSSDEQRLVCMEWEIVKGANIWQCQYNECEVVGVSDIVVDGCYKEAINIVLKID